MKKRQNQKSEQKLKKNPKRPEKALQVEPNLALFLTGKKFKKSHIHTNKRRTLSDIHNFFYTCQYIANSDIDQIWKNKTFHHQTIVDFLRPLTYYNSDNTDLEELNKLNLSTEIIKLGLGYLESRFHTSDLISKQITEFKTLLETLKTLAFNDAIEQRALNFYKMRHKMSDPPELHQQERSYVVMCKICWAHRSGQELKSTITKISHHKLCLYDKNNLQKCIEIIPPKNICNLEEINKQLKTK